MTQGFDDISNSDIDRLISEWIHSERDRNVLHRRFVDGITFERLAEEFCMSTTQIKRIVANGTRKVLLHIEK